MIWVKITCNGHFKQQYYSIFLFDLAFFNISLTLKADQLVRAPGLLFWCFQMSVRASLFNLTTHVCYFGISIKFCGFCESEGFKLFQLSMQTCLYSTVFKLDAQEILSPVLREEARRTLSIFISSHVRLFHSVLRPLLSYFKVPSAVFIPHL